MIVYGIDTHDATFESSTDKLHLLESILGKSNYDDQLLKLLKYSEDDFKVLNVLKDRGFIDKYNIEYILNAKFSEHEIDLLWWISKLNYKVLESELWEKFDTFISMLYISMLNNSNNSNLWIFWWRDGVPYEIWVLPHDSEQKYVLSMEIEDWVGVKFCLSTHPDIKYHSELQKCETVDWW